MPLLEIHKIIISLNIWQLASIFTWHSRYVANCILWTLLFTYSLVAIVLIDVKYKLLHKIVIQYQISLIICQYWRKTSYLVVHTYFFFMNMNQNVLTYRGSTSLFIKFLNLPFPQGLFNKEELASKFTHIRTQIYCLFLIHWELHVFRSYLQN